MANSFRLAALCGVDGKIVAVAGYDGTGQPPATDIIQLIKEGFVKDVHEGKYRATVLIYDVRVALPTGEKSDAIAVSLNHRDNYSMMVFFPYKRQGREVTIGTPFAQLGEADIFPPQK
ncbi:MAG: hypothetical protein WBG18_18050 [Xanthobacteraceae bacterium]